MCATIDGHFVRVEGKLARYRLHLGTAAVHIEPGHHLCIVPDRSLASRQPIYLPFAEGSDPTHTTTTPLRYLLFNASVLPRLHPQPISHLIVIPALTWLNSTCLPCPSLDYGYADRENTCRRRYSLRALGSMGIIHDSTTS